MAPRPDWQDPDLPDIDEAGPELGDGQLVKEQSRAEIYVMQGGAKLLVPSSQEFAAMGYKAPDVQTVPDGTLKNVPVAPRDGTLLRERSRPHVYVMTSGRRFWIPSPDAFVWMGHAWSNIRVVPNGSLAHIPQAGTECPSPTPPSLVFRPDNAGKWFARTDLSGTTRITSGGKEVRLVELRGWLVGVWQDCNPDDPDWHFELEPDPSWTDSLGINLGDLFKVGDVLNGIDDKSVSLYRRVSTPIIKMELNGWRQSLFPGRTKPQDWTFQNGCQDSIWPYDPQHPVAQQPPLQPGQYVRVVGSLVTDQPHAGTAILPTWLARQLNLSGGFLGDNGVLNAVKQVWGDDRTEEDPAHAARWSEIHPPDIIAVLPGKDRSETVRGIALVARNGLFFGDEEWIDATFTPPGPRPPGKRAAVREMVGKETNVTTIVEGNAGKDGARIDVFPDRVRVRVKVRGQGGWGAHGKFKAIYRVYWEDDPTPPECAALRGQIAQLRTQIATLQESKAGLDPRNKIDRREILAINRQIEQLRTRITPIQQKSEALGCPP